MFSTLARKINELTNETDNRKSLDVAIETANEPITLLNPEAIDLKNGEDALDENIPVNKFPNYKAESWFAQHPYFSGERVALNFYESDAVQIKFYWLGDTATKARVSAGVMLTPNWEDSDLTRNDQYKVGIDFFLSANTRSLLMVVSNNGNLRILEFSDHLSNTQQDILQNLRGVLTLGSKEQIHKTMWDSLALSEVNKKFYLGIAEKFNELLNHLVADGKDAEDSKLFASRLLGRLLFIWFLRRKNIIQEQYGYFVIDSSDSTEYYDLKLKKLFFETLNTPAPDRKHSDDKTPYLNGGLFEAHDNDWAHQKVSFPTGFFNRLYEHLEQYNFTTDESSPEYEQVAIDPEMLGRVFESLLATQVTETGDQARKAKGAFYTPREIVAYMCKESMRQYLYTKLDNENQNDGIDKLLDISDSEWELQHTNAKRNLWGEKDRNTVPAQVLQALDDLKVLDPACGSGAFPMGILQLMLKTYERLDGRFDAYKTKVRIVQENIYGIDIEPMAVEISRLRAWLSLVVDDEGDNNVEPLPNLDFKFVCANSLMPLEQQTGLFADASLHEKLAEVRTKFFNARVPSSKDKWKAEYYKLTGNGQHSILGDQRENQLKSFDPFKNSHPADFFDADYMFGVPKFNVVIGNPPYVDYRKIDQKTKASLITYDISQYSRMINLYTYFFEAGIEHLHKGGVLVYISPQQYLIYDNLKGLRDLLRKNTVISLSDFARANVFEVGTYPFVSLIKKVPSVIKLRYVEFTDIKDMSSPVRTLELNNPLDEPVNISAYPKLLSKIELSGKTLRSVTKDIFVASSSTQLKLSEKIDSSYGFVEASQVHEYAISVINTFITKQLYSSQSFDKQIHGDIIYTSRMTSKIRAAFVKNNNYLGGKVNIIIPDNNGLLVTGLLNSKLINFWYREKFSMQHMQGGALPINAEDLKKIPVSNLNMELKKNTDELVQQVIDTKVSDFNADISQQTHKIDQLVYQMYDLNPDEIAIIEGYSHR